MVSFRKNNVNKPKNFFHFLGHHPLTEEQFDTIFPDLFMLKGWIMAKNSAKKTVSKKKTPAKKAAKKTAAKKAAPKKAPAKKAPAKKAEPKASK